MSQNYLKRNVGKSKSDAYIDSDDVDAFMNEIKGHRLEIPFKVAMFLGQLGIKYNKITKDEFVTLMGILRKSDLLKSPGSKRGKGGKKRK